MCPLSSSPGVKTLCNGAIVHEASGAQVAERQARQEAAARIPNIPNTRRMVDEATMDRYRRSVSLLNPETVFVIRHSHIIHQ